MDSRRSSAADDSVEDARDCVPRESQSKQEHEQDDPAHRSINVALSGWRRLRGAAARRP
jgi:hypothetical protein